MADNRSHSPLHVHVDDDTPVHVHIRKPRSLIGTRRSLESGLGTMRSRGSPERASPPRTFHRSAKVPWVPAPGKTTRNSRVTFEGSRAVLELGKPDDDLPQALNRADLDTEEESRIIGRARDYEKKISGLMQEVGTLKNEVDLQTSLREIDKKAEDLERTQSRLEKSEEELRNTRRDLWEKERDNRRLLDTMGDLKQDISFTKGDVRSLSLERERLLKKLVQAEMDSQEATAQANILRDLVRRLKEEKKMSADDLKSLSMQKEALGQRLTDFEETNRSLRKLLQDHHAMETDQQRLSDQKSILINKLVKSEEDNERLREELKEMEKKLMDIKIQYTTQKDETLASATLQASLEQTRAHLQRELRQREGDCNRMAVQIRTLESDLAQEKIEVDHLQELLRQAHVKHDRDKEALKKATRVQKQRAARSENTVDQLNVLLMEKEQRVSELQAIQDEQRALLEANAREKAALMADNSGLRTRLSEVENLVSAAEDKLRHLTDQTNSDIHQKSQQIQQLRSEQERLKTQLMTAEERFTATETECHNQEKEKRELTRDIAELKLRAERAEHEADTLTRRMADTTAALDRVKLESTVEIDRVRRRLEERLRELEPLPEMLKTAELGLHEANERLANFDKSNEDKIHLVAELTAKLERQAVEADSWRDRYRSLEISLQAKLEAVERRLREVENKNTELMITLSQKEEALGRASIKLDERTQENATLARQLELALAESRRVSEDSREKSAYKERALQDRLRDLDEQLTAARAETAKVRREKEEHERKVNSRLYDLKDRLEQSHATNRSMQNYVSFLKSSYASVMGDVSVSSPLSPVRGCSTRRESPPLRQPQF